MGGGSERAGLGGVGGGEESTMGKISEEIGGE